MKCYQNGVLVGTTDTLPSPEAGTTAGRSPLDPARHGRAALRTARSPWTHSGTGKTATDATLKIHVDA